MLQVAWVTNLVNAHEEVLDVDDNAEETVQLILPHMFKMRHMVT